MRTLTTAALLDAWERGAGRSLVQRTATLLAAACPDMSLDQICGLSIGQRDRRLLALQELTFGRRMSAFVQCARCRAQLEFSLDAANMKAASPAQNEEGSPPQTFTLVCDAGDAEYRLPTSVDLASVASERNVGRARTLLLKRCVIEVRVGGEPSSVDTAPPQLLDAVVEDMARADPQGDLQVAFRCPSCGDEREVAFDIASFFWHELDAWVARILRDVHTLARAYGWREADILAMSPLRREHYLDLVGR